MSSSEDDYMSDTFLVGCVKDDIRPGLIHGQSRKRDHEILKNKTGLDEVNKLKNRPKRFVENESREIALSAPISTDNKGFAMLQKLGFKPGSGLGKASSGRTEPVPIKLKTDRQGLGRAEALQERCAEVAASRKAIHERLTNVTNYRSQLAEKSAERRALIDLRKSQRICQRLDQDEAVTEPVELWYWPKGACQEEDIGCEEEVDISNCDEQTAPKVEINDDNECTEDTAQQELEMAVPDDCEELTVWEKLEILTSYLRRKYYYCIWCAIRFEDEEDIRRECPGPTHEDH